MRKFNMFLSERSNALVKAGAVGAGFLRRKAGGIPPSEDTAVLTFFDSEDTVLHDKTPEEIGDALTAAYRTLDQQFPSSSVGSTAVTTVYHGDTLVTATVGDSSAFIVAYGDANTILGVKRLNSVTHKPIWQEEQERIKHIEMDEWTDRIYRGRVSGRLAVSRGIGDNDEVYRGSVIATPTIDIESLSALRTEWHISEDQAVEWRIIACSDGITDRLSSNSMKTSAEERSHHEALLWQRLEYLKRGHQASQRAQNSTREAVQQLLNPSVPVLYPQENDAQLAQSLVESTSPDDDTTAVVCTLGSQSCLIGVYDGHGGARVSNAVSHGITAAFMQHLNPLFQSSQHINEECVIAAPRQPRQRNSALNPFRIFKNPSLTIPDVLNIPFNITEPNHRDNINFLNTLCKLYAEKPIDYEDVIDEAMSRQPSEVLMYLQKQIEAHIATFDSNTCVPQPHKGRIDNYFKDPIMTLQQKAPEVWPYLLSKIKSTLIQKNDKPSLQ